MFAAIIAVVLAGCKQSTLDASEAQTLNNKIYQPGENEPFTGLYTGIEVNKILNPRMIYTLDNYASYSQAFKSQFAGSLCQVPVENGKMVGRVTCQMRESEMIFVISLVSGRPDGVVSGYRSVNDDTVLFSFGIREDNFHGPMRFHREKDGKEILMITWFNGDRRLELSTNADTGNVVYENNYLDGWFHGRMIHYADDGTTILYRATYKNGTLQGMSEEYDPETKILTKTRSIEEIITRREMYRVSTDGQVTHFKTIYYDTVGNEIRENPKNGDLENTCLFKKINAFREEHGQSPVLGQDILMEWDRTCKAKRAKN